MVGYNKLTGLDGKLYGLTSTGEAFSINAFNSFASSS